MKLACVTISGVGAGLHVLSRSRAALAIGGAASSLGAVGALLLGVSLRV